MIVDRSLLPLLEQFMDRTQIEHVFVVEDSYEELLAGADPDAWVDPELDEKEAAAMCYTSGTTGHAEGRRRTRTARPCCTRSASRRTTRSGSASRWQDTILPVVPMFHANAWGYPYLATMLGAKLVYPGPHLDPESLLDDLVQEQVTWAAGVPTIWMGILQLLDANPGKWDLSSIKAMLVGGSAVPRAMIAAFEQRHGISIVQGWGMTETSPVASTACLPHDLAGLDEEGRFDLMALAGMPLPFVEIRARAATRRSRGTARRWASSRCAGRGSRRRTTTRPSRPTAGPTTAGSRRATSSRSCRAASSRSRTARRT